MRIDPLRVDTLISELDGIAMRIVNRDFSHDKDPIDKTICGKCGLRFFCGT